MSLQRRRSSRRLLQPTAAPVRVARLSLALVLASCTDALLKLDVSNESANDAELQILGGIEGDPDRDPFVHYTEVVIAGARQTLTMERPGPNEWTLYVNGVPLTDSLHWPSDNSTLDFSVIIHGDGTAEVTDD